jgi:MOSC domain-containing protein YiiM
MEGRILYIHIAPAKKAPVRSVDEAEVLTDGGIRGDRYERSAGERQVTLVVQEELEAAGRILGKEITPGSTRRNITVSGIPLARYLGRRVALGEVELLLTVPSHPCENMETWVGPGARQALQGRGGVGARVLKGGRIRVGDPVRILEEGD